MLRHLLTSILLLTAVSLQAAVINSDQAKQIAADIYQEVHGVVCPTEMQIVTQDEAHCLPSYYVCQPASGEGYFIISAVDTAPQLIAYAETGSYSLSSFPEYFRQHFASYVDGLSKKAENTTTGGTTVHRAPQHGTETSKTISPLMETLWKQTEPYNLLCPGEGDQHSLTGCAATAMAQVMYYHQYPVSPVGSGKARYNHQALPELDFTAYSFDWEQMLPTYRGVEYTDQQAEAVATLMLLCGYGANMNYSLSGSGAYQSPVRRALIENFGYSTTTRIYLRDSYERDAWLEKIIAELEAGRPIIYSGRDSQYNGHTFVVDGIGVRNTVHVNWGWGEGCNINIDVDVLTPRGSNDGYNREGEVIFGIQPALPDEDRVIPPNFDICDSLTYKPSNGMIVIPSIYNLGYQHESIDIALELCSNDVAVDYLKIKSSVGIDSDSKCNPIYDILELPTLTDGDYSARLVIRQKGSDQWLRPNAGDRTDGFLFSIVEGSMVYGQLTGIHAVSADHEPQAFTYNLWGHRVGKDYRGIVIRK